MVIPWQGFPLSEIIKIADPLSSAKFVQFVTVFRPEEMPGQKEDYYHGHMLRVYAWMKRCTR